MATSDDVTTKIDAGAWGTIHVSRGCGGVVIDAPLPADGERSARVILNAAQGDALIAAIGRALGRAAPTSTPLALYFEEKAKVCDKGRAHGQATGNLYLQDCSKAEAETWRHAASLVVEAAHGEQGPTVPRVAVEALRARLAKWCDEEGGRNGGYREGMTVGIMDAIVGIDALLAPATPTEKG